MSDQEAGVLILGFLKQTVHPELELDTELIESGLLDSFKAVELIAFIEEKLDLRIMPTDLTPVTMATPRALIALALDLRQRAASVA